MLIGSPEMLRNVSNYQVNISKLITKKSEKVNKTQNTRNNN